MSSCASIDPLVTPYIDGELVDVERAQVEHHIRQCHHCSARVTAERAVAALCGARRTQLQQSAPPALLARCQVSCVRKPSVEMRPRAAWRGVAPLAAAAVMVVAAGWYATASSAQVIATELALDHVKCRLMNAVLGTRQTEAQVRSSVADWFGWRPELPGHPEQIGLELVGSRPCMYDHGTMAHIMYRRNGALASVYMLPGLTRPAGAARALGHEAVMWSTGDRTFVVVERSRRADVDHLASFFRASLK